MSTITTNLGLVKPALTDIPDITAMNQNWDIIDSQLAQKVNKGDDYRPNLLINGDFKVNQRGQSSYTGVNSYTVDRWRNEGSTSITPSSTGLHITCQVTTDIGLLTQYVEDYAKYAGKTITETVKIENLNLAGNTKLSLYVYDGVNFITKDVTTDGTYSFTTTIDTNPTRLQVGCVKIGTGTAFSVDIEWIKLEVNDHATPFIPRSYGEELTLCQRYYNKTYPIGVVPATSGATFGIITALAIDSNLARILYNFPVRMRATPTVTIYHFDGSVNYVYKIDDGTKIAITGTTYVTDTEVQYLNASGAFVAGKLYTFHCCSDAEL